LRPDLRMVLDDGPGQAYLLRRGIRSRPDRHRHRGQGDSVAAALRDWGLDRDALTHVLLTHWHPDHAGSAAEISALAKREGGPTEPTPYLRIRNSRVTTVDNLLAATANPENPNQVNVSQPSAALVVQAEAQSALNGLFLGLGAIALLVGAVGVANIMIISVLERRSEIGLRRALGATRGHIRTQFLSEAVLLGLLGGAVGVALGVASTVVYAHTKGWSTVIPIEAWAGGIAASVIIGAVAGLIPALRAARLSPTQALWSV
jgi:putative ABC transport system permease protein